PNKIRGEFLAKAAQGKFTPKEIQLANAAIIDALLDIEKRLSTIQSDFIFGTKYTMADTVCSVRLFRFGRLNIKIEVLQDQYPYTAAFYQRIKQRSSFCQLRT
ncbi:MAG: glutathione S-transferase family protein, partial [Pseudomonadota bacterium]|nr:glutathione S-transferase family protein [Pseudomonadota bacterium]